MAKAEGRAYTSVYGLWQSASGQSDYGDGQSFFAPKDNDHWCEKPFCGHKSGEVWVNELCLQLNILIGGGWAANGNLKCSIVRPWSRNAGKHIGDGFADLKVRLPTVCRKVSHSTVWQQTWTGQRFRIRLKFLHLYIIRSAMKQVDRVTIL